MTETATEVRIHKAIREGQKKADSIVLELTFSEVEWLAGGLIRALRSQSNEIQKRITNLKGVFQ